MEANITQLKLLKLHVDRKLLKPPKKKWQKTKLSTIKEEPHKAKSGKNDKSEGNDGEKSAREKEGDQEPDEKQNDEKLA